MTPEPGVNETPREWAERVLREHGPVPDHIARDIARSMRDQAGAEQKTPA